MKYLCINYDDDKYIHLKKKLNKYGEKDIERINTIKNISDEDKKMLMTSYSYYILRNQ